MASYINFLPFYFSTEQENVAGFVANAKNNNNKVCLLTIKREFDFKIELN